MSSTEYDGQSSPGNSGICDLWQELPDKVFCFQILSSLSLDKRRLQSDWENDFYDQCLVNKNISISYTKYFDNISNTQCLLRPTSSHETIALLGL